MSSPGLDQDPIGFGLIVMVASLGGLESVSTVLTGLPARFPVPILLLQHGRRRDGQELLAPLLQRRSGLPVRTGEDGAPADQRGVTVVPRGQTATLDERHRLALSGTDGVGSGDALLTSAAAVAGPGAIGVVLTGLLHDGANGVRAIKRAGGRVLAEDPRTARAGSMPSSAIATGCVDFVLPRTRLAAALVALTVAPGGADLFAVPTPAWASLYP